MKDSTCLKNLILEIKILKRTIIVIRVLRMPSSTYQTYPNLVTNGSLTVSKRVL